MTPTTVLVHVGNAAYTQGQKGNARIELLPTNLVLQQGALRVLGKVDSMHGHWKACTSAQRASTSLQGLGVPHLNLRTSWLWCNVLYNRARTMLALPNTATMYFCLCAALETAAHRLWQIRSGWQLAPPWVMKRSPGPLLLHDCNRSCCCCGCKRMLDLHVVNLLPFRMCPISAIQRETLSQ